MNSALPLSEEWTSLLEGNTLPALPLSEEWTSLLEGNTLPALPQSEEWTSLPEGNTLPALPLSEEWTSLPEENITCSTSVRGMDKSPKRKQIMPVCTYGCKLQIYYFVKFWLL